MKRLFLYAKRIFLAFKEYLSASFYNFIEFICQILIFIAIIWWIQISTQNGSLMMQSEAGSSMQDKFGNNIYELESLARMTRNYIVITTFIFLLLIIRTIPFFTFSRRMCKFFDVLDDAKYDMAFFQILVCLYILGFAFAGYLLFGSQISSFSFLGKSFIGCLQIISGSITNSDLQEIHITIGPIYYFIFLVNYLIFGYFM